MSLTDNEPPYPLHDIPVYTEAEWSRWQSENAKLKGLLWFAWHEFNAIRARHGAPIDQYNMRLCTLEWWDQMTEAFAEALGENGTTPWPTPEAKAALPVSQGNLPAKEDEGR